MIKMPQNYKCVNNTLELSHRRVSFELSLPLTAELFQQWTSSPSSLLYSASQVLVDPCMHYVRMYVHIPLLLSTSTDCRVLLSIFVKQ